jgi:hypothetical protein
MSELDTLRVANITPWPWKLRPTMIIIRLASSRGDVAIMDVSDTVSRRMSTVPV